MCGQRRLAEARGREGGAETEREHSKTASPGDDVSEGVTSSSLFPGNSFELRVTYFFVKCQKLNICQFVEEIGEEFQQFVDILFVNLRKKKILFKKPYLPVLLLSITLYPNCVVVR